MRRSFDERDQAHAWSHAHTSQVAHLPRPTPPPPPLTTSFSLVEKPASDFQTKDLALRLPIAGSRIRLQILFKIRGQQVSEATH